MLQIWGMTETCPLGVVATPTPALAEAGEEAMDEAIWTRQGRLQFGIELKIVDEDGADLPWDGESSGALLVRGPWTIQRYFRKDEDAADADGWFDTGDIATIDRYGFMRITDRKKDVIKSGGEWISSIDLENIAVGCPGVKIAAVVGVPHPKWEERPILVVERHDGADDDREGGARPSSSRASSNGGSRTRSSSPRCRSPRPARSTRRCCASAIGTPWPAGCEGQAEGARLPNLRTSRAASGSAATASITGAISAAMLATSGGASASSTPAAFAPANV